MSILSMDLVGVKGEKGEQVWQKEDVSVTSVTAGPAIIIPGGVDNISVTVVPGAGCTVKVQATTDILKDVEQEAATVTWIDWDAGLVTVNTQDSAAPVTAVRINQTIGTAISKIKVRAQ